MRLGIKLVKQKPKTVSELVTKAVKSWNAWMNALVSNNNEPLPDGITKSIHQMKVVLYGDGEQAAAEEVAAELVVEMCKTDILMYLCHSICVLPFEARKDAVKVFGACVRRKVQDSYPGVEYIQKRPKILEVLLYGYGDDPLALNYGSMLRHCLMMEPLCRMVLASGLFYHLFDYVQATHFHVASDAFISMQESLTRHPGLVSSFLQSQHTEFFAQYHRLLTSHNYVTRRQSTLLLRQVLKDYSFVMAHFISHTPNLMTMMNLMKDSCRNNHLEALQFFMEVMTLYPAVAVAFLKDQQDKFIALCMYLLKSESASIRLEAVQLLHYLLSAPSYTFIKEPFLADENNLMAVMTLLRDGCEDVQLEAFKVFQVFVENPRKPRLIVDILVANQNKLLRFLPLFNDERDEYDHVFHTAKMQLIEQIRQLC